MYPKLERLQRCRHQRAPSRRCSPVKVTGQKRCLRPELGAAAAGFSGRSSEAPSGQAQPVRLWLALDRGKTPSPGQTPRRRTNPQSGEHKAQRHPRLPACRCGRGTPGASNTRPTAPPQPGPAAGAPRSCPVQAGGKPGNKSTGRGGSGRLGWQRGSPRNLWATSPG